jgi:uncharacterized protein YecE (DUF72 family)
MRSATGEIRIGVSGWTYSPWRGAFYPKGLPQKRELAYAATQFNALEINGTFYGMQMPASFAAWAAATPSGFCFAIKGPRYLTHMLKLTRAEAALANFFASGPLAMGDKLGPVLWQFPASFPFDEDRLSRFFDLLPRTRAQAAVLARQHDHRLRAPAHLDVTIDGPIRHAIEIRHESFRDPRFIALLRRYNVALVCADTPAWPLLMDMTAEFVYCRLHGSTVLYNSRYSDAELDQWAARVANWSTGVAMTDGNFVLPPLIDGRPRDVYVFFDNTDKLEAPGNARGLMRRLGVAALASSGSTVPA